MANEIEFGNSWTASQIMVDSKPRWQLSHAGNGVMLATTAHVALIEEVVRLREHIADIVAKLNAGEFCRATDHATGTCDHADIVVALELMKSKR